jgi:hypothetical protein
MKMQRLAVSLTVLNLALLLLSAARAASTTPRGAEPVLRGRALEIVDVRGTVRSRLDVEESGEVVLRMTDGQGTIRVKLGAGEDGSGLLLADETTAPGIHLVARRVGSSSRPNTTGIMLEGADGRREIRP